MYIRLISFVFRKTEKIYISVIINRCVSGKLIFIAIVGRYFKKFNLLTRRHTVGSLRIYNIYGHLTNLLLTNITKKEFIILRHVFNLIDNIYKIKRRLNATKKGT